MQTIDMEAESRRRTIAAVIAAELDRQGVSATIDHAALAEVVEAALSAESPAPAEPNQGRRPHELNATNDD